jgi:ATP-dependent protease Clp ATPase subunit
MSSKYARVKRGISFQVTRVIIEASTHRLHLRKSNTLTFDSTGSSKPLAAIASTIAQFMDVPYVRCDCSYLNPVQQV